jgi:hypothetical protein
MAGMRSPDARNQRLAALPYLQEGLDIGQNKE